MTGVTRNPVEGGRAGGGKPRVLVVVGTRPEAIKMAPVVHALRKREREVETELALTGQHRDLVSDVLAVFRLVPDHDLALMQEGQTLYDVAAGCLTGLRSLLEARRPDLVLVQGDTASVFFGALVGFFEGVAVGHVEAGLRSGDMRRPFPEEGFRRLTSVLADLHFAPTAGARDHLLREGIPPERIHLTGNPVVDALLRVSASDLAVRDPTLAGLLQEPPDRAPFALLTTHRRESFGAPMDRALGAVRRLVETHPTLRILAPVHPNPRVRESVGRLLGGHPRIHLVAPLVYPDLVRALARARLVLTDSGGIQEEAPTFGTPVLVLREVTERPEGVEAGVAELVGTDPEAIHRAASARLAEGPEARAARRGRNPYGDGQAGSRIAEAVLGFLASRGRRLHPGGGSAPAAGSLAGKGGARS
jgi:UDP-N-acetylglucosamine 2-epimerase (non-hydrolysing)